MRKAILGLGGALVDHIFPISEERLQELKMEKGGMVAISEEAISSLLQKEGARAELHPGGSVANTLKGLAKLGYPCLMHGRLGADQAGQLFLRALEREGIATHFTASATPTAQLACMITPDGQRTMRGYLGAVSEMSERDLNAHVFEGVDLFHTDGYGMWNGELIPTSLEWAKKRGAQVSFSLASFEVVERFRDSLLSLLPAFVDVLFSNEDEARALCGCTPKESCYELQNLCEVAVVSVGKQGCFIGHGGEVIHCPAPKVRAIDSVGAGDLFASGFLHGYLRGLSLEESGRMGCELGAAVVQVTGAQLPDASWEALLPVMAP